MMGVGKILVVDDEPLVRQKLLTELSHEGYHVVLAQSGSESISLAAQEQPDLILMDLEMPGMSGIETIQELKKDIVTSTIPIIVLTAFSRRENVLAAIRLGACDFVVKNHLSRDELFTRIQQRIPPSEPLS